MATKGSDDSLETEEESSHRCEAKNMEIVIAIIGIISLVMATKKRPTKPVFGQLTLSGSMALDWMKNEMEITIAKVLIGPIGAFPEYNIPPWALENPKIMSGDVAVIHRADKFENPVFVTQVSILRALEIWCVEQEAKGAETRVEKKGSCRRGVLFIAEGKNPTLKFVRDLDKGEFAPYVIIEV